MEGRIRQVLDRRGFRPLHPPTRGHPLGFGSPVGFDLPQSPIIACSVFGKLNGCLAVVQGHTLVFN
jgi:hypothetical protein